MKNGGNIATILDELYTWIQTDPGVVFKAEKNKINYNTKKKGERSRRKHHIYIWKIVAQYVAQTKKKINGYDKDGGEGDIVTNG